MSVPRIPRRGAIRCEVAADVAKELLSIAEEREGRAQSLTAGLMRETSLRESGDLYAEANALRSLAYAINKHNVQP